MTPEIFDENSLAGFCDKLAEKHAIFKDILHQYGYPPFWHRVPGFETLLHIILEQQVSLASALAAFNKLKQALPEVTPVSFLSLSDETLRNCYFSRQKIIYTRHLATLIANDTLQLQGLPALSDQDISIALQQVKGIGSWTANVFLMMCLNRTDIFPLNDIALISSIKHQLNLPANTTSQEIAQLSERWKPYRSIAAYMLWHAYLSRRARR